MDNLANLNPNEPEEFERRRRHAGQSTDLSFDNSGDAIAYLGDLPRAVTSGVGHLAHGVVSLTAKLGVGDAGKAAGPDATGGGGFGAGDDHRSVGDALAGAGNVINRVVNGAGDTAATALSIASEGAGRLAAIAGDGAGFVTANVPSLLDAAGGLVSAVGQVAAYAPDALDLLSGAAGAAVDAASAVAEVAGPVLSVAGDALEIAGVVLEVTGDVLEAAGDVLKIFDGL